MKSGGNNISHRDEQEERGEAAACWAPSPRLFINDNHNHHKHHHHQRHDDIDHHHHDDHHYPDDNMT